VGISTTAQNIKHIFLITMALHLSILFESNVPCTVFTMNCALTRAIMRLILFTSLKTEGKKNRKIELSYLYGSAFLSALVDVTAILLIFHVALYYYKCLFTY